MKESMPPIFPNHIPDQPCPSRAIKQKPKEWRLGAIAKSRDNQGLGGVMDEARIYSKILSALELQHLPVKQTLQTNSRYGAD